MRNVIIFSVIVCVLFCSCSSTYYYAILGSTDSHLEKLEEGDFIFENDSLWITHSFEGEDAPIQITVFNKLDVPLYVDWDRSALIIDNTAYSYNDGITRHFSDSESTSYNFFGTTKTYTNTEGVSIAPERLSFIPPHTKITHQKLRLSAEFDGIDMKHFSKKKLVDKDNNQIEIAKVRNYGYEDSPFYFSSLVTVYTNPDELMSYKSDFYTTNLFKTKIKPQNLPSSIGGRGDIFYQCKRPNNTGWEILGVTAVLAGTVALNVLIPDDNNRY